MKVLLVTPPMTQINTPYPATAYLTSFLQSKGHQIQQVDLSLELALKLFSKEGLAKLKAEALAIQKSKRGERIEFFLSAVDDYESCIDPVLRFLQGKDPSLALRLSARSLVPEGARFLPLQQYAENLLSSFGELGVQDKAKYIASLFLDDVIDLYQEIVDPQFEFSRYGEKLSSSQPSFSPMYDRVLLPPTMIDDFYLDLFIEQMKKFNPEVVGFTIPFPGNLLSALKMGAVLRKNFPKVHIVMGGGFVNTELREISDPRFFEFTDSLLFDDGEKPFELLLQNLEGKLPDSNLLRIKRINSKTLNDSRIIISISDTKQQDYSFKDNIGPSYAGLRLSEYVSMLEMPNPMHRMWSDFRWNKMMLAHGCYWKKCTFCDVSLDYIGRFESQRASELVTQMERIINESGTTGFHFVDEAAPPALLRALSKEILLRKLKITWWGNLRFDIQFDEELCKLMSEAGCVAVTGGLEVASPRLLKLINKGVSIQQVAQVTRLFKKHGIFVHAYLMYGFASQTVQETIDSLEVVRQLFVQGCLDSAYWHRFLTTVHSPVAKAPEKFGVVLAKSQAPSEGLFSEYEIPFTDSVQVDHDRLGIGLKKALYNYMHNIGMKEDVRVWFDFEVPKTSLAKRYISNIF